MRKQISFVHKNTRPGRRGSLKKQRWSRISETDFKSDKYLSQDFIAAECYAIYLEECTGVKTGLNTFNRKRVSTCTGTLGSLSA